MATLSYWKPRFETTIDGQNVEGGDLTVVGAQTVTIDRKEDKTFVITTSGTAKLWDVADSNLSSFNFMWIESDTNVWIQIVVDDNATNGEAYFVRRLFANSPMMFAGGDDAQASDGTVDNFNGTADVIERINVKNSTTGTARVRIFVGSSG